MDEDCASTVRERPDEADPAVDYFERRSTAVVVLGFGVE